MSLSTQELLHAHRVFKRVSLHDKLAQHYRYGYLRVWTILLLLAVPGLYWKQLLNGTVESVAAFLILGGFIIADLKGWKRFQRLRRTYSLDLQELQRLYMDYGKDLKPIWGKVPQTIEKKSLETAVG